MNVLFVDDQISVLDGIEAGVHFDTLGIENVYYATSAKRAMEIIGNNPVDVVVSDVEMPGEDGLWLVRNIREQYPEMLTVLLTSHADFEYAQESVRLGCFDYIVQPAPAEEIERVLRRALQHIYERNKRNQLYEVGRRMQTGEMELLDGVAMGLFSVKPEDVKASIELLTLLDYPVTEEKQAQVLILTFGQFRKSETPISAEKEIHKQMFEALKQAEISYPIVPLSTVNLEKQFILLLFSATQDTPGLTTDRFHCFFDLLCKRMPKEIIRCYVGNPAPLTQLGKEYRRVWKTIDGLESSDVLKMKYNGKHAAETTPDFITGSGARWRSLLAAGQCRILMNEFDKCLEQIANFAPSKAKALCDLHQRMTHMFFNYFYENNADVHELFQNAYTYNTYMDSYSDIESLREAMLYMMKQVRELGKAQAPKSDIEKAKSFIMENIADPITVKDVADYVCLSAEYFTKSFKKETGYNIKEYITWTKVEAAKDMLEHSNISVGMVALELGYTNFSHFSQVFKKYENVTPSEYRSRFTGEKSE